MCLSCIVLFGLMTTRLNKCYYLFCSSRIGLSAGFPLYFGIEIPGLFKNPEVAFSRTDSRRKFTAWTVLKQHYNNISVITGQF